MTKKDRLLRLIEHFSGGNKSEFARMLGVSPQAVNTWISRDTFDIDTVYAKCITVSAEWLLTGEGDMLKSVREESQIEVKPINESKSFERKLDRQEIFLYDFQATAGISSLFDNNTQNIIDTI